nr:enoyl-CoA hydratase-related protein [Calditerricola satsumensis]
MTLTRFAVEREERVAIVTLDHPPANTLDTAAIAELGRVLEELEADAAVKVVVLTGAGRFFAAGATSRSLSGRRRKTGKRWPAPARR